MRKIWEFVQRMSSTVMDWLRDMMRGNEDVVGFLGIGLVTAGAVVALTVDPAIGVVLFILADIAWAGIDILIAGAVIPKKDGGG